MKASFYLLEVLIKKQEQETEFMIKIIIKQHIIII